jgi:SNF2 family DNA or RNA helicase
MEPIHVEKILIESPPGINYEAYNDMYFLYNKVLAMIKSCKNPIKLRDLTQQSMKLLARLRLYCDIMSVKNYVISEEHIDDNDDDENFKKKYQEIEYSIEEKLSFYNTSIKIKEVYDKIESLIYTVPHKRIIVFSAFVTSIDILETITNHISPEIKTFQYIGKRTKSERDEIVSDFTDEDDDTPMVLFATLGSGSCGLNLVPCSTVILVDVSLNPFDEFQAINRVHRITQTNRVNVYKFCMKDMIEERILLNHDMKIEDAKSVGLIIE